MGNEERWIGSKLFVCGIFLSAGLSRLLHPAFYCGAENIYAAPLPRFIAIPFSNLKALDYRVRLLLPRGI